MLLQEASMVFLSFFFFNTIFFFNNNIFLFGPTVCPGTKLPIDPIPTRSLVAGAHCTTPRELRGSLCWRQPRMCREPVWNPPVVIPCIAALIQIHSFPVHLLKLALKWPDCYINTTAQLTWDLLSPERVEWRSGKCDKSSHSASLTLIIV